MNNQTEIETAIRERLEEIKAVPPRNPQVAARARARFLTQAASAREAQRNKGWRPIFRMQQFAMNMAVALAVIVGLLVGGGTTVKAAQDDLPGEPLYAVKTFSEDVSLQFQTNPAARVDLLMQFAQTRVDEMARLVESGRTPPESLNIRLEQQVQQALTLCSNLDDAALHQKLPQVRDELQQQERDLQNLQAHAGQGALPRLEQTRAMLRGQLNVVDTGMVDPAAFRNNVHNGIKSEQLQTPPAVEPTVISTPLSDEQNGQATTPPGGPENGNGVGPTMKPGESQEHVTPTPRNDHPTPGNNAGGNNNKDKDKDPKDKDPKNDKPGGKPNK
jgi:hypothetical protein